MPNQHAIKSHFLPAEEQPQPQLRTIRSFVLRQGRLTQGQQRAVQQLWPQLGIEYQPVTTALTPFFAREAPLIVEIGFGMGATLVEMAQAQPENNFLGVEVHLPGVGSCLAAAQQKALTNLRLICHDAATVLEQMIPDSSLAAVRLFFPDPWPKKRHHKRRLVQASFLERVQRKLQLKGRLHLATDWQPYAEQMLSLLQANSGYRNLSVSDDYVPRPPWRPLTKFEQRGQCLGHGIWDLLFVKCTG